MLRERFPFLVHVMWWANYFANKNNEAAAAATTASPAAGERPATPHISPRQPAAAEAAPGPAATAAPPLAAPPAAAAAPGPISKAPPLAAPPAAKAAQGPTSKAPPLAAPPAAAAPKVAPWRAPDPAAAAAAGPQHRETGSRRKSSRSAAQNPCSDDESDAMVDELIAAAELVVSTMKGRLAKIRSMHSEAASSSSNIRPVSEPPPVRTDTGPPARTDTKGSTQTRSGNSASAAADDRSRTPRPHSKSMPKPNPALTVPKGVVTIYTTQSFGIKPDLEYWNKFRPYFKQRYYDDIPIVDFWLRGFEFCDKSHVWHHGGHAGIIKRIVKSWKPLMKTFKGLKRHITDWIEEPRTFIVAACKSGKHRSVSLAFILCHILSRRYYVTVKIEHLSVKEKWQPGFCSTCRDCTAMTSDKAQALAEALEMWDKA